MTFFFFFFIGPDSPLADVKSSGNKQDITNQSQTEFHSLLPTWKTPQSRNLQRFQLSLQVCHPVPKDPAGGTREH